MYTRSIGRLLLPVLMSAFTSLSAFAQETLPKLEQASVIYKVTAGSQRLEMTEHTSRLLTMDQKIPQAQVNNPEILELTPLAPNQIQASAKARGVTQINIWGEDQKLYTIDVIVRPDARELQMVLQSAFPNAALQVVPVASAVMISGFVDTPEHIDRIIRIAEEYYPKVINNMTVGGCQQVLLHVKVMEVSRTKLRQMGFDWAKITGGNAISSGPTGLITDYDPTKIISMGGLAGAAGKPVWRSASNSTFAFNVVNGSSGFFGVLDAMRQDNLIKIAAEPTLVTVSGRPASFISGGEIPVPEPQSLGTISIAWKKYGTQVEFMPIVLGNGNIRLEVRPRVSALDTTQSFDIGGTQVPGIKSREADTGVELMAGETLAIAGLVQTTIEAQNAGLPWISELPYIGAAFRSVEEKKNEVELLILVTPELVEGMAASEVPQCGPGMQTTSPSDWELYMKGHLEVPNCCPTGGCGKGDCQQCNDNNGAPPDGMMMEPNENVPTPTPATNSGAVGRQYRQNPSNATAPAASAASASRNGPPGFIGPVGYDVVE